jgi:hypothetical protein
MTLPSYRSGDPLYTVIYRDTEAKNRLQKWSTTSRSIQARVDDNKMHLFDHNTLMIFVVTWNHAWDNILVWDTYLKRHISF